MRDQQPRLSVAVLVENGEGANRAVVLGRRQRGGNIGKLVLPGGGVELGEHWRDAGVREFKEETGLTIVIHPENDPADVMEFITPEFVRDGSIVHAASHRVCLVVFGELAGPITDAHDSAELTDVRLYLWRDIPWDEVSPQVRKCLEKCRPPEWLYRTTACKVCGVVRHLVAPGNTQGLDCAASVFHRAGFETFDEMVNAVVKAPPTMEANMRGWYLKGHYGSRKFDTMLFRFKSEPPEPYRNADPVCDDCVQKLIDGGLIEEVPGTYP